MVAGERGVANRRSIAGIEGAQTNQEARLVGHAPALLERRYYANHRTEKTLCAKR